jgi:O-acetyl-ADP-ribose deacetylase (regulator of RNase III)
VWRGGGHGEPDLLASYYRSSLALARQQGARSIAFPAISCGVYGYPVEQAAAIAVREIHAFQAQHGSPETVMLVAFGGAMRAVLRESLDRGGSRDR